MEENIKQWYEILIDIYGRSKVATVLAEKMYLDFDNKSATRDIEIIIITSLYHSAAINLFQVFDSDNKSLNIYQFRNAYYGKEAKKPKFKIDEDAKQRLYNRRNKVLAHADKCTFLDNDVNELHLYVEDLKKLLKSIEDELFPLAKSIIGTSFGRDLSTGEWFFQITRNIEVQYDGIKNLILMYKKIYAYMKKNCMQELFSMIYGKGDTNNDQTKNANAQLNSAKHRKNCRAFPKLHNRNGGRKRPAKKGGQLSYAQADVVRRGFGRRRGLRIYLGWQKSLYCGGQPANPQNLAPLHRGKPQLGRNRKPLH